MTRRVLLARIGLSVLLAAFAWLSPGCATGEPREGEGAGGPGSGRVLTVALDGSGDFRTVAAALEAAPVGAVVRIGAGTFEGSVRVTRQVTLEGTGADGTTLASVVYSADALRAPREEYLRRAGEAKSDGEREAAREEFERARIAVQPPTLLVEGAAGVIVRRLTLTGRGDRPDGGIVPGAVVEVSGSVLRMEEVAVAGSPSSGVLVGPGSQVEIRGCLVAGAWATGIAVGPPGDAPSQVRIADSDIRNCWHRGITVAPGNRSVAIEGCRISGSSWHGIRYDDAAPLVQGNLIFGNARSGIYASGRTEGRILGNLFLENGMSDVSCWSGARDLVEGNTFARSRREAVAILGASDPVVRRNVFFECTTALLAAAHGGAGPGGDVAYAGGGKVEGNLFWRNGSDFGVPRPGVPGPAGVPLPSGNHFADPMFIDPARRDFTMAAGSPARSAGAGAAALPSFDSPWPIRPEEAECAPGAAQ